ncbi:MAG: radical SAM protein [Candidatus Aminicenantes bacterium]|nr:MAG: radical SAM protein [Candidatus Aminicenantes bacterium]
MEISNLTLIVTDDCNFNCSYCLQKKEKKYMDNTTIKTAVDFFYPFLKGDDKIYINFYGGEPLLAYDKIKYAVQLLQEKNKTGNKNIECSLTTNGSLITDEMLDFFNRNQFGLMLSFDGLAQDKGRKKGTLDQMVQVMKRIRAHPGIDFEINSVFTPGTISSLTDSLRFMIQLDRSDITLNFSTIEEWTPLDLDALSTELKRLSDFLFSYYQEKGTIPVKNFQAPETLVEADTAKEMKRGIFRCNAGKDRMAVTPEGKLWGCFLFHDYFKTRENHPQYQDYFLGTLTDFIANYETRYPVILANYSELRQDFFQVDKKNPGENGENEFCFLCEDIDGCVVCPVNAAYTSGALGKVSYHKCQLIKIQRHAQENFRQKLLELSP